MQMIPLIEKKRDKKELNEKEIEFIVKGAAGGSIPDYQLSAFLMAVTLNGMTPRETLAMTLNMAESGDMLDLSSLKNTADKHSTGGVGDKTTLITAPAAASLGCTVAKMSGRGLGYTGGTVDKLESVPGFKTDVSPESFKAQAEKIGICLAGQSGNFAPADKRLYALRDVTATVNSIPLIASSIMSKKLAAGAESIVLDVKFGSGAFMKTAEDAEELAREMVEIGRGAGRRMSAVITDMSSPLGYAVGNSLEVAEAVEVLKGGGPEDLAGLSAVLAAEMYSLSFGLSAEEALAAAKNAVSGGDGFDKLCELVSAQGGDVRYLTGEKTFPSSESVTEVISEADGYIISTDCELIGKASVISGAGRAELGEKIDPAAGIRLFRKYGDYVGKGELIGRIYGRKERLAEAAEVFYSAFELGAERPPERKLIYKIIR